MNRFLFSTLFCCALLLLWTAVGLGGTFDERLWERYAEINISANRTNGDLAGVYLIPQHLGDMTTKPPFADLRVVTDRKEEVAWQIIEKRHRKQQEEIPHQMQNLSLTEKGETWLELLIDKPGITVNAVEIITPNTDFFHQVQVLGSADGKNWNIVRRDGVIFSITKMEQLYLTRITFPQISFRYIALRINNNDARPLTISDVKVLQESVRPEQTYVINGNIEKSEINPSRKESSLIVCMNTVFPVDRLMINTAERNFQRLVEVQVKGNTGDWERWARGIIFNFNTATMHESKLAIDIPSVATRKFRLVFKNLDSPPLSINNVTGKGYERLLVFKNSAQKMYLFWGNPIAQQPQYDLSGVITKQNLDIPIASLGQAFPNSKFAGNNARLPFTERYKHLLYIFVMSGIAALLFLQYLVFRRIEK